MRHLDEATILALRDGEPVDPEAHAHLDGCAVCANALSAARRRAEDVERSLTALDRPVEATAAKAGVRARVRQAERSRRSGRWSGWHLGRAAVLVLVTAGAAAALPGSPLRSLLSPVRDVAVPNASATDSVDAGDPPAVAGARESGIAVAVPDGVVQVIVRGAQPGTDIVVSWTDQSSARVTAPAGSRFTYAAGRVEVDASRGTIRIGLPSGADRVDLEVDGRPYLTGSQNALQVQGPVVERGDDEVRFRVTDG